VTPALFDLLENYYRPKRQIRAFVWVGGLVLFVLGMCWAASMLIFGVGKVPTYVCAPGKLDYDACVQRYESRAGEFAESRALVSLIPLAIGVLFFAAWFPIRNKNSPALVRLFRDRPMDGVWVYPLEIQMKKRGQVRYRTHRVVVATVQRKKLHVEVLEEQLKPTLAMFSAALPHATVGYSDPLEAQFRSNPESLRQRPQQPYPQQPMPYPQQHQPQPGQHQQQPPYPQQQYPQQQYPQQQYPQQQHPQQPYPQQPRPPGWPPRS